MNSLYSAFARADPVFYDHPTRLAQPALGRYSVRTPRSWTDTEDGNWRFHMPAELVLPEQGWKIHLSTTTSQAAELLRIATEFCVEHAMPFKHLPDASVLVASNAKDANRAGSGKFVTIYTSSYDQLELALRTLGDETAHLTGPYVLSDLRWVKGPVFVRYGGFHRMSVDVADGQVPAIRHPDGHLVPDVRQPTFAPPVWADIPPFLLPLKQQYDDVQVPLGFPTITGALHHSNAGGVYVGVNDGRDVVVKEARPFAGLTPDGRDAVERSAHEARVLSDLSDNPRIGSLVRAFEVHGHHYLVLERVSGKPLQQAIVARHPLIKDFASDAEVDGYNAWAVQVGERLQRAVQDLHDSGLVHGDLHPGNVIVDDDGAVVLIDLEMASPIAARSAAVIGAPGYTAPAGVVGKDADQFSLDRIKLSLFAPVAPLFDLEPSKTTELSRWASERFNCEARSTADYTTGTEASGTDLQAPTTVDMEAVGQQLLADATPEREDRLWPGDPAQFDEPRFALAHGALGPILALHASSMHVPNSLIEWAASACLTAEPRTGLMDGLSGAAAAFEMLGRSDTADELVGRCLQAPMRWNAPGLYGGPAGTALGYLRLHGRHPELLKTARAIFDELAGRANGWSQGDTTPIATGMSGVLRGASGTALLALRLYDLCGDAELITLAAAALRTDLRRCVAGEDGGLLLNEGWRLLPYFGAGSAGIATVALELAKRDEDFDLVPLLEGFHRAVSPEFVLEAGLFEGRAGLMLASSAIHQHGASALDGALRLRRHHSYLRMHSLTRPSGVGFPGKYLLRASCDLATGSAGVLWALARLRGRGPHTLPLLDLPPVAAPSIRVSSVGGGESYGVPALSTEPGSRRE